MQVNDIFGLDEYTEYAHFANKNGYIVEEIDTNEDGARRFIVKEIVETEEDKLNSLRDIRQVECFSIINRGQLWYDNLTYAQKQELKVWYNAWLDVTETRVIPTKPKWLV